MKNKVLAFIICRLNSKRLPYKMLKKINGITVIDIVISRLKQSKMIDEIVLLTSKKKIDDKFLKIAEKNKINILRGPELNVLKRMLTCCMPVSMMLSCLCTPWNGIGAACTWG